MHISFLFFLLENAHSKIQHLLLMGINYLFTFFIQSYHFQKFVNFGYLFTALRLHILYLLFIFYPQTRNVNVVFLLYSNSHVSWFSTFFDRLRLHIFLKFSISCCLNSLNISLSQQLSNVICTFWIIYFCMLRWVVFLSVFFSHGWFDSITFYIRWE